jgi:hypothetical protein
MNENVPPVPNWMIQAVADADALWRENMALIRAVQQYMEDVREAWAIAGPLLAYADQISRAANAGIAQLTTAGWQQADRRAVSAGASLTVTPIMFAEAKVTRASESAPERGRDVSRRDAGGSSWWKMNAASTIAGNTTKMFESVRDFRTASTGTQAASAASAASERRHRRAEATKPRASLTFRQLAGSWPE